MSIKFDDRLRDLPVDSESMAAGVVYLLKELESKTRIPQESARLSGQIGSYLRILNRLDEAKSQIDQAIKIYQELNDEAGVIVNQIRLAQVLHWQMKYSDSEMLFQTLLNRAHDSMPSYLDFVFQHYGKLLFDQGKYSEAKSFFDQAMEIRLVKKDADLIESTRFALEITEGYLKK